MPNIASVLKSEIFRVARKEISRRRVRPKLFTAMRQDLLENHEYHLREFVILPNKMTQYVNDRPRMVHYESDHPAVVNQVGTLVLEGYVERIGGDASRIFRFRESFVDQILTDRLTSKDRSRATAT